MRKLAIPLAAAAALAFAAPAFSANFAAPDGRAVVAQEIAQADAISAAKKKVVVKKRVGTKKTVIRSRPASTRVVVRKRSPAPRVVIGSRPASSKVVVKKRSGGKKTTVVKKKVVR